MAFTCCLGVRESSIDTTRSYQISIANRSGMQLDSIRVIQIITAAGDSIADTSQVTYDQTKFLQQPAADSGTIISLSFDIQVSNVSDTVSIAYTCFAEGMTIIEKRTNFAFNQESVESKQIRDNSLVISVIEEYKRLQGVSAKSKDALLDSLVVAGVVNAEDDLLAQNLVDAWLNREGTDSTQFALSVKSALAQTYTDPVVSEIMKNRFPPDVDMVQLAEGLVMSSSRSNPISSSSNTPQSSEAGVSSIKAIEIGRASVQDGTDLSSAIVVSSSQGVSSVVNSSTVALSSNRLEISSDSKSYARSVSSAVVEISSSIEASSVENISSAERTSSVENVSSAEKISSVELSSSEMHVSSGVSSVSGLSSSSAPEGVPLSEGTIIRIGVSIDSMFSATTCPRDSTLIEFNTNCGWKSGRVLIGGIDYSDSTGFEYEVGTELAIEAKPNFGNTFTHWTLNKVTLENSGVDSTMITSSNLGAFITVAFDSLMAGTVTSHLDSSNIYPWQRYGNVIWMTENLNDVLPSMTAVCYDGNSVNCENGYGRLYPYRDGPHDVIGTLCWAAFATPQWVLPTDSMWTDLEIHFGVHGPNVSGFNVLPAGTYSPSAQDQYYDRGNAAYFWSRSLVDPVYAQARTLAIGSTDFSRIATRKDMGEALSVRCSYLFNEY